VSVTGSPPDDRGRTGVRSPEIWALGVIVLLALIGSNVSAGARASMFGAGGPDLFPPHTLALNGDWLTPAAPAIGPRLRLLEGHCKLLDRLSDRQAEALDRLNSRMEQRRRLLEKRTTQRLEQRGRELSERLREASERLDRITF
jgi:hypothetical protein